MLTQASQDYFLRNPFQLIFISPPGTVEFCRRLAMQRKARSALRHTYFNTSQNQSSSRPWVPTQHEIDEVTLNADEGYHCTRQKTSNGCLERRVRSEPFLLAAGV